MNAIPEIVSLQKKVAEAKGRREALKGALSRLDSSIAEMERKELLLEKVAEALRSLMDDEIRSSVSSLETLLTGALQEVFEDQDLKVKANVDVSRGKVTIDLVTVQNGAHGVVEGSAIDSFGGSILSLQSLLLRVILIQKRKLRPLLLVDESFTAFDTNYIHNMGQFLNSLAKKLGFDILMITHSPVLFESATRAYRIVRKNDASEFVKVR